ncbi:MAG TPA: DNA primase [Planctomycetota bacterium]|nr:DNA primase [Planctomycetota bacterium]
MSRVKAATDLVTLVEAYAPLRRRGRHLEGLCPFHEERTPSFKVHAEEQFFKCFGCGKGGDCFSFVEEIERVSFREALEMLAERAGIPLRSGALASAPDERAGMREALRFALERFRSNLLGTRGKEARAYLESRGISTATAEEFALGCALPGWDDLLAAARGKGIAIEALERAGLVVRNEEGRVYDRFRDRLIFPILDGLERPVGFGGRVLREGEKPKYLNSPESSLFGKGRLLYALERARKHRAPSDGGPTSLAVVEGYTDVLFPHQEGVRNVVATLGTALTPDHARLLRRHADTVVLVFDSDEAGARASARGVEVLLAEDLEVRVAVVPEGKDPCDFVRARGGAAFADLLGGAADFFEHALAGLEAREDLASVPGRVRAADALLVLLAKVSSPVRRGEYLKRIASRLLLSASDLDRRLGDLLDRASRPAARPPTPGSPPAQPPRDAQMRAEEDCLRCCVQDPGAFPAVAAVFGTETFTDPWNAEIYRAMATLEERGEEVEAGRLMLVLAGHPARARVAGWLAAPLAQLPAALHGSLEFLRRARAGREAEGFAEAYRRARLASDPVAERGALEALHARMREAKTIGR